MNIPKELIKIADIHSSRLIFAINGLNSIFPLSASAVDNLSEHHFLLIELLTTRFSKLQDFMGTKLIDAFLNAKGELISQMTMIDKLNKLEKLGLIDDSNLWINMREVRNHLSHEYPDHPEITAQYLNQVFELAPLLLLFLDKLKNAF